MNLSTQHAWIITGALAAVFVGAYLFYFGPQLSDAEHSHAAAMATAKQIDADWKASGAGAVALGELDGAIAQRNAQAVADVDQVFNVPAPYEHPKAGDNPSTYFFNQVDLLKKNPAVKGILNETKFGWDRFDNDNKYPVELKLRHLAMIDRVARAAGACGLYELKEFIQSSAIEITPAGERAAAGAPAEGSGVRGGRRPTLAGDTGGPAAPTTAANPAADTRLVRVTMTVKFRGAEGNLVKFLALVQTPSPDANELTMVYLNHCALSSNEKTMGSLDGEMQISAIFPLTGDDLKSVLANANQTILK